MLFGSPELWIGETSTRRRADGEEASAEYRVIVENRGSDDATGCTAAFTLKGVYGGLPEGRYRFAIECSGRWVREGDPVAVTIPDGESVPLEAFRVTAGADPEDARVEFPTGESDDGPPVDRYLLEGETVTRIDECDDVPLPVFVATEWETLTVAVTGENHETTDRELAVSAPDDEPPSIDQVRFDADFDDRESVPSFKTF